MKRFVFWQILIAALLMAPDSQAQSLKDLLNKENIEKAVNAITGKNTASMEGTWTYTGPAIEFESDNLLQKAGGSVAANAAENKLKEQLARVGIKEGQMSFTFNADSTFTAKVGAKSIKGTYSYDASTQNTSLKFMKLIPLNAKINCTSANMDLLFNSDKLLKLITLISSKSNNSTLKTIGSLANLPTTATSTELNNCCRILLAANGRENSKILFSKLPCSISIRTALCDDLL